MQNSSTGGLDFVTMAIKAKHPYLPFGNLTFGAALAVILLNGAVFRDVDSIIYGLLFNFLVAAVNIVRTGFYSATGRGRESSILSLSRGVVAIVVFACLLSWMLGVTGVWLAFPAAELFTLGLGRFLTRKTAKEEAQ